jgi:hypothetical protein
MPKPITPAEYDRIIDHLAGIKLKLGPNTIDLIAQGRWKSLQLSVSERHAIASTVLAALGLDYAEATATQTPPPYIDLAPRSRTERHEEEGLR